MNTVLLFDSIQRAVVVAGLCSGIPLASVLLVGLTASILQSLTQVQDISLTFTPKLVALSCSLFLCMSWFLGIFLDFSAMVFDAISRI